MMDTMPLLPLWVQEIQTGNLDQQRWFHLKTSFAISPIPIFLTIFGQRKLFFEKKLIIQT
jgi:hypothetical protein